MREASKELYGWYELVMREDAELEHWVREAATDPENGINFTRLANCAAKSVSLFLRLADIDPKIETPERVSEAIFRAMEEHRQE